MARDPYRRMRRTRRNDENPYGIYLAGPREPYGVIALSAVAKWVFRHRSAFVPFLLALAAFTAAGVLHAHHAAWWPAAVITAAGTALLGFPHSVMRRTARGRRTARVLSRICAYCGTGRAEERAYAAVVIACAGGWISAATAIGQTVKPLPATELILTGILGIPWWCHRRRRAKVRVESAISAWPPVAEQIGLAGSRITSVTVDAWGWTARVILKRGITTATAIQKIPAIESGISVRPGSVRIFPDADNASAFTMRVTATDPHANPVEWPGKTSGTITRPVDIGVSENGWPVAVLLLRRNVLIGGTTGSGKSGIVNVIIAALASCRDAVLWGIDLKGGMELQPWESCLDRLATTPDEANDLFRDAVAELNRRARAKAAQGVRVLSPTANDPALVIIADEYAELPDESHDCADSIARRGRAVAVSLIAATQRPTQTAMGETAVRSQMDVRICLRVRERRDTDLILGQGSFNSGWHAHQFARPGEFMVSDPEHSAPEKNRGYLITDQRVARHAAECARMRPSLPEASRTGRSATQGTGTALARADERDGPETALRAALRAAGPDGVPAGDLMAATGMTRPTLYRHLQALARAGRAVQVSRGTWRAAGSPQGRADGTGSEGR
jgi:DNA segregation ATPase FtsK/SpoIIIE, S-DNA-T family